MKIRLVSHASIIATCGDIAIWTDPWLIGKVFNDSWTMYPEPVFHEGLLENVDYIWLSHEHPDHFNIPTLRSLPNVFKQRVTVLFQENNSRKVFDALETFGFPNHLALPHRCRVRLGEMTEVYCYQVGQMDSCLGIIDAGDVIVNVNDAAVNAWDCRRIQKDIGSARVVLNQFSIAGYAGFPDYEHYLSKMAGEQLEIMVKTHRDLGAETTIPFASFILFSTEDNKYVNGFANRPRDVYEWFSENSEKCAVLAPGDTFDTQVAYDSAPALAHLDELQAGVGAVCYDSGESVELSEIEDAFRRLSADIQEKYPQILLRLLKPVTVGIPDLAACIRFSLASGRFDRLDDAAEPDLMIASQPLLFTFSFPFGLQTLGVSARFKLLRNSRNWMYHRSLMGLYNAEIYLRLKHLANRTNLKFLNQRRRGLLRQIGARLAFFGKGR